ncbi:vacuolar calcium ion transporter [Colletotrichum liriopes]|uniref:Vacuolar calcium ion transporter n=1 Tax=Colletotrichum liriopes TaxID=708192 RepID=A0AA37LUQ6_9PEZI|nr:vacuolar calcium ion transporter [Colletotrichum liriopes]
MQPFPSYRSIVIAQVFVSRVSIRWVGKRPYFNFCEQNEIRIVQASLLGSILANLLLILGMSFFLGGLRYREQLGFARMFPLSLISSLQRLMALQTAFHASFQNTFKAEDQTLKISRGTSVVPVSTVNSGLGADDKVVDNDHLSRTAAILLLLFSTGLVAVCAEFLVGSINEVVETSPLGEIFIGLIILPIVGNAAEHVTAVTVAMKNKMDLAIGVAVGSSIQIALFITPIVVIIGWALDRDMSLYFTLFETVCLFVSTFIVNFLVLDGRSNYLEGALLCATYIIIALVAFFYPNSNEASSMGA